MAMSTTPKNGSPFNKKSSIVVLDNKLYDSRTNDLVTTTPTSGDVNTRYDSRFDDVAYYVSASGY
jgi:hypothetical protein